MTINRIADLFIKYATERNGTLYDAYKKPSMLKADIWNRLAREADNRKGYLEIITHNVQHFTCGYIYQDEKTKLPMFVLHTPTSTTETPLHEIEAYLQKRHQKNIERFEKYSRTEEP